MNQFFDPHRFPSPLGFVPWPIEGPTGPHFFGSDRFALSARTDLSLREKKSCICCRGDRRSRMIWQFTGRGARLRCGPEEVQERSEEAMCVLMIDG